MDDLFTKESGTEGRESYVLRVPGRGAVEMWRENNLGCEFGGIEVHSFDESKYWVKIPTCRVLGGECWTDGSSLAFEENKHLWDIPNAVRSLLEEWSRQYLGV